MNVGISSFIKRLHLEVFKPRGFKKARQNFRHEFNGVVHLVQFQGSCWNSGDHEWKFYTNLGIGFTEFGRMSGSFMGEAYAFGRINELVAGAPLDFVYTHNSEKELNDLLIEILPKAFEKLDCYRKPAYKIAKKGIVRPFGLLFV